MIKELLVLRQKLDECFNRNDIAGAKKIYDQINAIFAEKNMSLESLMTDEEKEKINAMFNTNIEE